MYLKSPKITTPLSDGHLLDWLALHLKFGSVYF